MKEYVYADNAATTRLSNKAFESMLPYLQMSTAILLSYILLLVRQRRL